MTDRAKRSTNRPARPASSEPVLVDTAPISVIDLIDSSDLAQAERLFRIGLKSVEDEPCFSEADFYLIAQEPEQSDWQLLAFNGLIPVRTYEGDESRDVKSAREWLAKTSQKLTEEWERAVRESAGGDGPILQFRAHGFEVFLVLIKIKSDRSRFLVAIKTRSDSDKARECARAFFGALRLSRQFVEEHVASIISQDSLGEVWSEILTGMGDNASSLRKAARQIAGVLGGDVCRIYYPDEEAAVLRCYEGRANEVLSGPVHGEEPEESSVSAAGELEADEGGIALEGEAPKSGIRRMVHASYMSCLQQGVLFVEKFFLLINGKKDIAYHEWYRPTGRGQEVVRSSIWSNLVMVPILGSSVSSSAGKHSQTLVLGMLVVGNVRRNNAGSSRLAERVRHRDVLLLRQMSGVLGLVLEGQRYHRESLVDQRTQLFNRSHLDRFCCENYSKAYAVVFIDVDNFKDYNTKFGYRGGDRMIEAVASILREKAERFSDDVVEAIAYREGGDEFIMTLSFKGILATGQLEQAIRQKLEDIQLAAQMAPFKDAGSASSGESAIKQALKDGEAETLTLAHMAPSGISLSLGAYAHDPSSSTEIPTNPRFQLEKLRDDEFWRTPILKASRAGRIAKRSGGNCIVVWNEISRFAAVGTPVLQRLEQAKVVIRGGFRQGLREGFVFESFHMHGGALDPEFIRASVEAEIERAYSNVSVCKIVKKEGEFSSCPGDPGSVDGGEEKKPDKEGGGVSDSSAGLGDEFSTGKGLEGACNGWVWLKV